MSAQINTDTKATLYDLIKWYTLVQTIAIWKEKVDTRCNLD